MRAMILAAGRGERMRPLSDTTPKPLLKVGGIELIVWHIERLVHEGFEEIIINIAHLGEQIKSALGDGSAWGARISYSDEQASGALESAGGIAKALPLLGDATFLVVNGDIFTEYAFAPNRRLPDGVLAHLILVPNPPHHPDGDFGLEGHRVVATPCYTFSGIGYYDPKLFEMLGKGSQPLAPLLRRAISQGEVTGELYEGVWHDIGTPQRLEALNSSLFNHY